MTGTGSDSAIIRSVRSIEPRLGLPPRVESFRTTSPRRFHTFQMSWKSKTVAQRAMFLATHCYVLEHEGHDGEDPGGAGAQLM